MYARDRLITVFDPVICKTPYAPFHRLPFCKITWICIAPHIVNTPLRRSGMARVLKGFHRRYMKVKNAVNALATSTPAMGAYRTLPRFLDVKSVFCWALSLVCSN